jgi:hypothetical protein
VLCYNVLDEIKSAKLFGTWKENARELFEELLRSIIDDLENTVIKHLSHFEMYLFSDRWYFSTYQFTSAERIC